MALTSFHASATTRWVHTASAWRIWSSVYQFLIYTFITIHRLFAFVILLILLLKLYTICYCFHLLIINFEIITLGHEWLWIIIIHVRVHHCVLSVFATLVANFIHYHTNTIIRYGQISLEGRNIDDNVHNWCPFMSAWHCPNNDCNKWRKNNSKVNISRLKPFLRVGDIVLAIMNSDALLYFIYLYQNAIYCKP